MESEQLHAEVSFEGVTVEIFRRVVSGEAGRQTWRLKSEGGFDRIVTGPIHKARKVAKEAILDGEA